METSTKEEYLDKILTLKNTITPENLISQLVFFTKTIDENDPKSSEKKLMIIWWFINFCNKKISFWLNESEKKEYKKIKIELEKLVKNIENTEKLSEKFDSLNLEDISSAIKIVNHNYDFSLKRIIWNIDFERTIFKANIQKLLENLNDENWCLLTFPINKESEKIKEYQKMLCEIILVLLKSL